MQAARAVWREEQRHWPAGDLIFLDESGIDTTMVRRCARARHGQRAVGHAPAGHRRRLTMLGALGLGGLEAVMTVPRATNAAVFRAFVEQVLLPALKDRPHPTVILDNLRPHKNARVLAMFEAAGVAVRFLPAYSPDLNPIEPCWSKLTTALRARAARTLEALEGALPDILNTISTRDAQGWFRHCGYPAITTNPSHL